MIEVMVMRRQISGVDDGWRIPNELWTRIEALLPAQRVIARLRRLSEDRRAASAHVGLSERAVTILRMISEGCTKRQIGLKLNIAEKTVRNNITASDTSIQFLGSATSL